MCIGEANKSIGKAVQVSSATWCLTRLFLFLISEVIEVSEETFNGIFWFGLLALMVYIAKRIHIPDIVYSRERNAIIRMDELRKDYDSVSDLETLTKMVENNPDVEVYMYCKYSDFAGGSEKEVRFPIKPNSRLIKLLCEEEKNRLRTDMGKTKKIFNLPFHR